MMPMKKSSALLLAGTATAAATALAVGLKKNAARTDKPAAKNNRTPPDGDNLFRIY